MPPIPSKKGVKKQNNQGAAAKKPTPKKSKSVKTIAAKKNGEAGSMENTMNGHHVANTATVASTNNQNNTSFNQDIDINLDTLLSISSFAVPSISNQLKKEVYQKTHKAFINRTPIAKSIKDEELEKAVDVEKKLQ